jgi:hypothetical protein
MNKGFVAISSVLVIAAVVITIGVTVSLSSISEAQRALAAKRNEATLDRVEACIEHSLYSLNTTADIPTGITFPEYSCSVTINSHVGTVWTFTVTISLDNHSKSVQVTATRNTTIGTITWKEI